MQDHKIWPHETSKNAVSYGVDIYIRLHRFVRVQAFDRQTDRQRSIARCDLMKLDAHNDTLLLNMLIVNCFAVRAETVKTSSSLKNTQQHETTHAGQQQ